MLREALYEGLFELTDGLYAAECAVRGLQRRRHDLHLHHQAGREVLVGADADRRRCGRELPRGDGQRSSPYHSRLADVTTLELAGTYKVRIVLSSPNADFPRLLNIPVYRRGSADSGSFADGTGRMCGRERQRVHARKE